MKLIEFTALTLVQGNTYGPSQVVAFDDDAIAEAIIASGDATPSLATVFVEHIDRTEPV